MSITVRATRPSQAMQSNFRNRSKKTVQKGKWAGVSRRYGISLEGLKMTGSVLLCIHGS